MIRRLNFPTPLIGLAFLALLAVSSGALGHQSESQTREEVREAYHAVKDYTFERKDDLVSWLEARKAKLEQRISALEETSESLDESTRAQWEEFKASLGDERQDAARAMENLRDATVSTWKEGRETVLRAYQNLEDRLERHAEERQTGGQ